MTNNANGEIKIPQLHCQHFENGEYKSSCGPTLNDGFLIHWYPVVSDRPISKYTIYVKLGTSGVGLQNYDFKYETTPESYFFVTPSIGKGPVAIGVTVSVVSSDGAVVESPLSEVFQSD